MENANKFSRSTDTMIIYYKIRKIKIKLLRQRGNRSLKILDYHILTWTVRLSTELSAVTHTQLVGSGSHGVQSRLPLLRNT